MRAGLLPGQGQRRSSDGAAVAEGRGAGEDFLTKKGSN
jgi:hypothetical protein